MRHLREDKEAKEERRRSPRHVHGVGDGGPGFARAARVEDVLYAHAHVVLAGEAVMLGFGVRC